mmetsp:Transcript_80881/g.223720  ORF Transcript_80881/g.223720 Transcript_80881/m.223720 type:complete len:322 (+) Transcript_80881:665-1630(+)
MDHGVVAYDIRLHACSLHAGEPGLRAAHVAGLRAGVHHGAVADDVGLRGGLLHVLEPPLGALGVAGAGAGVDHGVVAHRVGLDAKLRHPPEPVLCVRHVTSLRAGADGDVDADGVGLAVAGVDQLRQPALCALRIASLGVRVDHAAVAHHRQGMACLPHAARHGLGALQVASLGHGLQLGRVTAGEEVPGVRAALALPVGLREPGPVFGAPPPARLGLRHGASACTALGLGPFFGQHERQNQRTDAKFLQQLRAVPVHVLHFREGLQQHGLIFPVGMRFVLFRFGHAHHQLERQRDRQQEGKQEELPVAGAANCGGECGKP